MARFVAVLLGMGLLVGLGRAAEPMGKMERLWADLAGKDEGKATRAALALAATPRETVGFLRKALKPVKLDPPAFEALLKGLDSDDFDARERAFEELAYHGKTIRDRLQKVLDGKPSAEVRKRVEQLIDLSHSDDPLPRPQPVQIKGRGISISNNNGNIQIMIDGKPLDLTPKVIERTGPQPAWVRAARVAAVLEHIGTPEARALLDALAAGEAEALPTTAARDALERLNK